VRRRQAEDVISISRDLTATPKARQDCSLMGGRRDLAPDPPCNSVGASGIAVVPAASLDRLREKEEG
jgi:hypothetical protein